MSRLLVHIATGPADPTRVALAFLAARTALEAGHEVDLFIAGDGVAVLRPETLDAGQGSVPAACGSMSTRSLLAVRGSTHPGCPARLAG